MFNQGIIRLYPLHSPLYLLGILCLLPMTSAVADKLTLGAGSEYFSWREQDTRGTEILHEIGPRFFIELGNAVRHSAGLQTALNGRLYTGRVDYHGHLQNGEAATTDTSYVGGRLEMDVLYSLWQQDDSHDWGIRFVLGGEHWKRELHGPSGYPEIYSVGYLRLGLNYTSPSSGWAGQLGMRYPFRTQELISWENFGYDDFTVYPKGRLSPYASLSYQFDEQWSLALQLDSYAFDASDSVYLKEDGEKAIDPETGGYWMVQQPESIQQTYGLLLQYHFR